MKRRPQRAIYRGPAGILVIDGTELVRDGAAAALTDEQIARLKADPTVEIELVDDGDAERATTEKEG